MPPRVRPDDINAPRIQSTGPGAYPVDPYTRAPESNLGRLAQALGNLAPTLQRIASVNQEEEGKQGEERAQADFLAMEKAGKAIKAGELQPSGSPWFRRHYHETIGRLAASKYNSDLIVASSDPATGLSESTDPADFDAFAAKFREAWMQDNAGKANPDFLAGFDAAAAGYDVNQRTQFAEQAGKRLEGKSIEALYAEHQVAIGQLRQQNATPEQIADYIKVRNRQQYFLNPKSGTQISNTTVQAIFDAARAYQDPSLLDVLDHVDSAIPGATLGQTQEVLSKIADVRNQIHADIKKDDSFAEHQQKKVKQDAIDSSIDGLLDALETADNPQDVKVEPFADKLTGLAPEQKERLFRIKDAFVRRDQQETALQAAPLFERAFRDTLTMEEVADSFSEGQISKDTAKELRALIKQNRAGKGAKALVQDTRFTKAGNDLEALYKNQMGQYFSPVTSAQAWVASHQLERDWVRFRMGIGREASDPEITQWLAQRSGELFASGQTVPITSDPQKQAREIIGNFLASQDQAQLTDWNKTRIVSTNFLARIQKEADLSKKVGRSMFSEAVKSFLRGYRVNKPEDVDAFLAVQSKLPEKP